MTALASLQLPPAAQAAARRLGSSRPLYAVSLSTALSQLIRLNSGFSASDQAKSDCGSSAQQGLLSSDASQSHAHLATCISVQAESSAQSSPPSVPDAHDETPPTSPRLTGQFIAQVGAHFHTALLECCTRHDDASVADSECAPEECDAEAAETSRYAQALSRAALQWGLLLLLAAEPALLDKHPKHEAAKEDDMPGCEYPQGPSIPSDTTSSFPNAASSSEASAETADTVIREALTAFELIVRISPPSATCMLPNILAWLDGALSCQLGGHNSLRSLEAKTGREDNYFDGNRHASGFGAFEDAASFVSQHLRWGRLSALINCTLGDCFAPGPLRRTAQHLQRTRLLALLLRCPRVLRCSSRLLAACAVPASTADGDVVGGSTNCVRGTVPQHTGEGETSRAAAEAEADMQQQLCIQTAKVLCICLQELKAALIPSSQEASLEPLVASGPPWSDLRFSDAVETTLLAAFLPPQLSWLPAASASAPPKERRLSDLSLPPAGAPIAGSCLWTFSAADSVAADETPRKAALYLLGSIKGLLLSFASSIQSSPTCMETFGVIAAAADKSVVREAKALLKQVDEFFFPLVDRTVVKPCGDLQPASWAHSVTRLCSLALTAKQLPKAYQINPARADSRILLTVNAATAVAELQIAERGNGVVPRCPLTGRLHLPQGLPDEQVLGQLPGQLSNSHSECFGDAGGGILAYLSDEGAFRMAIQVARILIGLIRSIPFGDDGRIAGLVVPPLLRVLDIPQSEVRFLGWRCLSEFILRCPRDGILSLVVFPSALDTYRVPILQALMGGFPVFNELDTCFDVYLEAYTTAVCRLSAGPCDPTLLQCQDFLIDMCQTVVASKDKLRSVFLSRTRPFVEFAGESANLRLYDWMGICLEALECHSIEAVVEAAAAVVSSGFRTLEQLLPFGMDIEEFVPQILSHLAIAAVMADDETLVLEYHEGSSDHLKLTEVIASITQRLASSADQQVLASAVTKTVDHFVQLHSDEPCLVNGVVKWLLQFSARLHGAGETEERQQQLH